MTPEPDRRDGVSGDGEWFSLYEIPVAEAYRAYHRFQNDCPAVKSKAHGGHWILTRYADVRAAAKDWQTFSSANGVDLPKQPTRVTVISSDPPLHDELRALDREVLNQPTIKALEPFVVALSQQLIEAFASAGSCDLVADFTEQLPPAVICRLIGLDAELALEMREVSIRLGSSFGDPDDFATAMTEFRGFVLPQIEARRARPRDDFLTRLATKPFMGELIEDEAIVQSMVGFLLAGHESTTAAMSSVLFHLLSDPARVGAVLKDEKLLSSAIEETLRLNTPFHQFRRTTKCPVDIGGVVIPAGADVLLSYAAANRDAEIFDDPDVFVIDRRPNPHVAMGFGPHACVGAPLARMELRVAVPQLLRRLPDVTLACDPATIDWEFLGGNLAFIRSLPAVFSTEPHRSDT